MQHPDLKASDGTTFSALSASDGTLRFLGILAAFLAPQNANTKPIYFIEEIENGIHPNRLHLLVQLIRQQTLD